MTAFGWTYLLLLIPLIGGFVVYSKFRTIVWWEWAISVGVAVLIMALTFGIASWVQGYDEETWSGHAYQARHTPWWRAEWTEIETYTVTDSKGNTQTKTRTVTKSRIYPPAWWFETTIGSIYVTEGTYEKVTGEHGEYSKRGHRPDFDRGDRYDYFSDIEEKDPALPQYPVVMTRKWDNPLKGTDSIKLGRPISDEEAAELKLHPYPEVDNALASDRVIDAPVDRYRWDQMMALLGPDKKVNLTLINFGGRDMKAAVDQRDYWRNGRKNDLVLCYGEGWAYVFGWSKSALVKQELESVLLENEVNDDIIPLIEAEVRDHFERYDWGQHEDTPRQVSPWAIAIAFILMLGTQVGCFFGFHHNSTSKANDNRRHRTGSWPWARN